MTDMTDRKMLITAAKAAGEIPPSMYDNASYIEGVLERWNPRENSLQSFRLAAKLKLQVSFGTFKDDVAAAYQFGKQAVEVENTDIEAAAREAIFLAAVEIGKGMK